ncbi:hypothetical protein SSX86_013037 [Deinandra increscens subsp. villosa]|uniref:Uncharacterized protein n=1 Tax=Deinandra increscens subsp. villosa TaxID=3103831 RepID=A0AAP0D5C7_9ASTR
MAAQNTLLAITSFTQKAIPQLLIKRGHLHTTIVRDHGHIWGITSSDQLKSCYNPLKRNESFCKCMSRPQQIECILPEDTVVKHAKLVDVVREQLTNDIHDNLRQVSLYFRILRQKGFQVSADVFKLFKGKDGKFLEDLKDDIRGLMELYEASHLCIEGENILDEAATFSSHMLQKELNFLDDKEAKIVRYTLENPHRRNLTCFSLPNSTKEIDFDFDFGFGFDSTILKELLELEQTKVQSIHMMEINEILRWWKDLGLGQDLNLARNQPLKWYVVPMVSLPNPNLSQQRIDLTKALSFIYIMDDIFDIYGTLNELTLLTEAVNRWDISNIQHLPYYIKSSFRALYDTTNEIACRVSEKHGFNPIKSLQRAWGRLCEAFLMEAKWLSSGHIPNTEEYLKTGEVSSGVHVFLVHMFFLLGDGAIEEHASLIDDNYNIVSSVSKILRLSDDLEGEQDNQNQHGRDGSYVKCFLMEHEYSSTKIARDYVIEIISDTWKCLNKECLSPNPFSDNFLKGAINLARLVPSMYRYNHNNNNSFDQIEEYIKSIL